MEGKIVGKGEICETEEGPTVIDERFTNVVSYIKRNNKSVRSLVVVEKGDIVHETYFNGESFSNPHTLRSMTKSIISALIGIAIDKKMLKGVNQSLREIFIDWDMSEDIGNITIMQLLTMTSGILISEQELFKLAGGRNQNKNLMEFILFAEVNKSTDFTYKSIDPHLLSIVLTYVTGKSAKQFGQEEFFSKLDIESILWTSDPLGNSFGSTGLSLTPRDIAKIGTLFLNGGKWEELQILSQRWIIESFSSHSIGSQEHGEYGYLWWINKYKESKYYKAAGYGGQYLYVIPSCEAVVVITADTTLPSNDTGNIIDQQIFPIILS
jgi:CubicO group peptidase (beta-lactamase class C family)